MEKFPNAQAMWDQLGGRIFQAQSQVLNAVDFLVLVESPFTSVPPLQVHQEDLESKASREERV